MLKEHKLFIVYYCLLLIKIKKGMTNNMKVALLQPEMGESYARGRRLAYGSPVRPPETGLAVLVAYAKTYTTQSLQITVLDPYAPFEENIREVMGVDLLGMTDLYTNHAKCLQFAERVKSVNPNIKTVLGGPNAAMLGGLILENHPHIDCVVGNEYCRDGEEVLLALIEGVPESEIPNLWYRQKDKIVFSHCAFTDLKKIPLWDFEDFRGKDKRLEGYLSNQNTDPWQVSPLALFSYRGCLKAIKEGRCTYCVSSDEGKHGRALPAENFWTQVIHLNNLYGAELFYVGDDIFTVSLSRMERMAKEKPKEAKAKIRAYGYLPDMLKLMKAGKLGKMAKALEEIGNFNLFFGSEHFSPFVCARANKKAVSIEDSLAIMRFLYSEGGIKSTIAILLGLPGESQATLTENFNAIDFLFRKSKGAFERLYISIAIPLFGSDIFRQLLDSQDVKSEYLKETGNSLKTDDCPDYSLLVRLMVKYFTSISIETLNENLRQMTSLAEEYIPAHRVGGFHAKPID